MLFRSLAIFELIDQHSVAAVLTLGVVSLAGYPLLSVGTIVSVYMFVTIGLMMFAGPAVSFAKGLFTIVPLIFIKNGKDKKPKQVRRPAQTT